MDLLCSFLIHSGFRVIEEALQRFFERGGRLRVLTTTYVGITERRVLERLVEMGAQVRVSYGRRTKLHAKSWILERDTGFSTAFIGSSNLSHSALLDGIEWNVWLAAVRDPVTFGKIRGTFERYWSGGDFEDFDADRFEDERRAAKGSGSGGDAAHVASNLLAIDLRPYPFQREILDQLHAERRVHGRDRALVVAAPGTGKTVIAALDFARARREKADLSLLFIAHRKEILVKSRATIRHALRDTRFGELMVDGATPKAARAVFATFQSLSAGAIEALAPDAFDWVIVDELHHAEAQRGRASLQRSRP